MVNPEIEALGKIEAIIETIDEAEARDRILSWMISKYSSSKDLMLPNINSQQRSGDVGGGLNSEVVGNEIPGIAQITGSGDFRLTVRDIKARSANDAAVRLAHVVIRAYQQLIGDDSVSSKKVLLPILRDWRAYDGNTRKALVAQKGILREGDQLSLDHHAKQDAERFIREILDDSIEGKWSPKPKARKKQTKE